MQFIELPNTPFFLFKRIKFDFKNDLMSTPTNTPVISATPTLSPTATVPGAATHPQVWRKFDQKSLLRTVRLRFFGYESLKPCAASSFCRFACQA